MRVKKQIGLRTPYPGPYNITSLLLLSRTNRSHQLNSWADSHPTISGLLPLNQVSIAPLSGGEKGVRGHSSLLWENCKWINGVESLFYSHRWDRSHLSILTSPESQLIGHPAASILQKGPISHNCHVSLRSYKPCFQHSRQHTKKEKNRAVKIKNTYSMISELTYN